MAAVLSKSRSVLCFSGENGGDAWYDSGLHYVELDRAVWEDMNKPDRITVTVEPGDLLNVEEEED